MASSELIEVTDRGLYWHHGAWRPPALRASLRRSKYVRKKGITPPPQYRYESKAHPMKEVSDRAMRFLIDQREVKQVQVARATGIAESTISEVLAGKVHLTRAQIGKLAGYFHVAPAVFLPEARQGTDNHGTAGR